MDGVDGEIIKNLTLSTITRLRQKIRLLPEDIDKANDELRQRSLSAEGDTQRGGAERPPSNSSSVDSQASRWATMHNGTTDDTEDMLSNDEPALAADPVQDADSAPLYSIASDAGSTALADSGPNTYPATPGYLAPDAEPAPPGYLAPDAEPAPPGYLAPDAEPAPPGYLAPDAEPAPPAHLAPDAEPAPPAHLAPDAEPAPFGYLAPNAALAPPAYLTYDAQPAPPTYIAHDAQPAIPGYAAPNADQPPPTASPSDFEHPGQGIPMPQQHPGQGIPMPQQHPGQGIPMPQQHPGQGIPMPQQHPGQGIPMPQPHPGQGIPMPQQHPGQGIPMPQQHPGQGVFVTYQQFIGVVQHLYLIPHAISSLISAIFVICTFYHLDLTWAGMHGIEEYEWILNFMCVYALLPILMLSNLYPRSRTLTPSTSLIALVVPLVVILMVGNSVHNATVVESAERRLSNTTDPYVMSELEKIITNYGPHSGFAGSINQAVATYANLLKIAAHALHAWIALLLCDLTNAVGEPIVFKDAQQEDDGDGPSTSKRRRHEDDEDEEPGPSKRRKPNKGGSTQALVDVESIAAKVWKSCKKRAPTSTTIVARQMLRNGDTHSGRNLACELLAFVHAMQRLCKRNQEGGASQAPQEPSQRTFPTVIVSSLLLCLLSSMGSSM